jgi:hypothetical protein
MPSDEMTNFSLTNANNAEITFVYDFLEAPEGAIRRDTKCGDIMAQEITCNVSPNPSFLDYDPSNRSTDAFRSSFRLVHVAGAAALESVHTQIFKDALYWRWSVQVVGSESSKIHLHENNTPPASLLSPSICPISIRGYRTDIFVVLQ